MASHVPIPSSRFISWRKRVDFSLNQAKKSRNPPYIQLATIDASTPGAPVPRSRTVVFRGFLTTEAGGSAKHDDVVKIITDARSEKVWQIHANPAVEINWWFPGSSEQFRIAGKAELHSFSGSSSGAMQEAVLHQWRQLKDQAREQFYWRQPGVNYSGLPGEDYSKERKYDFEKLSPDAAGGAEVEAAIKRKAQDESATHVQDDSKVGGSSVNMVEGDVMGSVIPPGGRGADGNILEPPETFLLLLVYPEQVKYLRLGDNFATCDKLVDGEWNAERINP